MAAKSDKYHKHLSTGDVLIREGDPGACAYVVEHGKLEVSAMRGDEKVVLANVGVGGMVGEMALVSGREHTATVSALEPCRLMRINRDYLDERLKASDPLLRHLLNVVITRFRDVLRAVNSQIPVGQTDAQFHSGDSDRARALSQLKLENQVEKALETGELELHYQPILRLSDQSVAGFEALIRWRKPGHELLIPPSQFIPVIERSPLILRVGHWILDICTEDLRRMQRVSDRSQPAAPLLTMSMNLATRQFSDTELFTRVRHALDRHELEPSQLQFEINESTVLSNWDMVIELLNRARRMGLNIAIDNFGIGNSALAYLHRLPASAIKLDRSFIRDLAQNSRARSIVQAIVRLASELGMTVVAEGAESREQARVLRAIGLENVQGFYFARPMARAEAMEFIEAQGARAASQEAAMQAAG